MKNQTKPTHTPKMEAFALLREELKAIRGLNAELLAALHDILDAADRPDTALWQRARAAIAKAQGVR